VHGGHGAGNRENRIGRTVVAMKKASHRAPTNWTRPDPAAYCWLRIKIREALAAPRIKKP
jgi:hypothetical protein